MECLFDFPRLLAAVRRLGADSIEGSAFILLRGAPGSGKSHLLNKLAEHVSRKGVESGLWLVDCRRTELQEELSVREGVVPLLLIDDLQWRSEKELETIWRIYRGRQRVVVVCATRELQLPSTLANFIESITQSGIVARPAGIGMRDAIEVLRGLDVTGKVANDALELLDNPGLFFAVASAATSGEIPNRKAIGYFSSLDQQRLHLLRVASIQRVSFSPRDVAKVADASFSAAWQLMEEAVSSGVLSSAPAGKLRFRHDVLRDTLISETPVELVREMHSRMAQVLIEGDLEPLDASYHLVAAGFSDQEAARYLLTAAPRLEESAGRIVVLERAFELAGLDPPLQLEVATELANTYVGAGEIQRAIMVIERSLSNHLMDSEKAVMLTRHLAVAYLLDDRPQLSLDVLTALLDVDPTTTQWNGELQAEIALRQVLLGDIGSGLSKAKFVLEKSSNMEAHSVQEVRAIAYSATAHAAYYRGEIELAISESRRAFDEARRSKSDHALRRVRYDLGWFLIHGDALEQARSLFKEELHAAQRVGAAWYSPVAHLGLGMCDFYSGRWNEAWEHLQSSLSPAQLIETKWDTEYGRAILAFISIERGNLPTARKLLGKFSDLSSSNGREFTSSDALSWAQSKLLQVSGDSEKALDILLENFAKTVQSGKLVRLSWLVPSIVDVAFSTGSPEAAEDAVSALEIVALRTQVKHVHAVAMRSRARLTGDEDLALAAVDAAENSGRLFDLALSYELAGALQVASDPQEAINMLTRATSIFNSMGAQRSSLRCIRLLATNALPTQSEPYVGWSSLTGTEIKVVEKLAEGFSNTDIARSMTISVRTVETHVRNIMQKLNLDSRTKIAAQAARLI